MKETWSDWIINRTTQAHRIGVLVAVAACLVALAIFIR
jgi:hypothetical protein